MAEELERPQSDALGDAERAAPRSGLPRQQDQFPGALCDAVRNADRVEEQAQGSEQPWGVRHPLRGVVRAQGVREPTLSGHAVLHREGGQRNGRPRDLQGIREPRHPPRAREGQHELDWVDPEPVYVDLPQGRGERPREHVGRVLRFLLRGPPGSPIPVTKLRQGEPPAPPVLEQRPQGRDEVQARVVHGARHPPH